MPTTTQASASPEHDRETWTARDARTTDASAPATAAFAGRPATPDHVDQFGQFGHDNTFLRHTKPASRRPR